MNRKQRRAKAAQMISRIVGKSFVIGNTLSLSAADGDDGNSIPRVSMVAYTGAPVEQYWSEHPIVVDLSSAKAARVPLPIFRDHNHGRVVGHLESMQISSGDIRANGVLSGGGRDTQEIVASAKNGFPWQVSIGGGSIRKGDLEFIREDESTNVNGRTITGPVYVLKNQTIIEVSIVSIGADGDTSAAVAASRARSFAMVFEQWLDDNGLRAAADGSPDVRASLQRVHADQFAARDPGDDDDAATDDDDDADADATPSERVQQTARQPRRTAQAPSIEDAVSAELSRRDEVERILEGHETVLAQARSERWSPGQAALAAIRLNRPTARPSQATHESNARPMEVAMLMRAGIRGERLEAAGYSQQEIDRATGQSMRNVGLHDVIDHTITAAGMSRPRGRITDEAIRMAFQASQRLEAAGASTASLPGIMSNVANRALWDSFISVNAAFPEIALREESPDFKTLERYRITALGDIKKVGPDGRINDGELSDEKYTNRVETYAQRIGVTREMMINDDIGGMIQIARSLGRKAQLGRERVGFTLLMANSDDFFHADNGNLSTGSGSALSIAGFTAAERLMLDQVDAGGEPILVAPAIVLVPTSLKVIAEQLMAERTVNETTTANVPKPASNPHAGKSRVVSSPFLNAQGLANQSDAHWYIFANPLDVPTMSVVYLNGKDTPTIEQGDLDFSLLGMQWRVVYDFGIAKADHRGAVRSNGS